MSCYVYFFIYVQVIADRDYGPGEEVRFWEFFFYLFVLVLLGYARVGRYHLELKFDNHVMLSVTAFFIFMFLWWIYTIHAMDSLSFLRVLKLLSVLLSFYYQFLGLVWFSFGC